MQIKASEISELIKRQIQGYERKVEVSETCTVLSAGDGIARVYGLEQAQAGELVEFADGLNGIVLNLEQDNVGVAIMGEASHVREGDVVKRTKRIAEVLRVTPSWGGWWTPWASLDGRGECAAPTGADRGSARDRGAPARARAAADRPQGHRLHGADRTGTARADHR
jgi:F-type H+-transporting ATPase subunit alpha